jgi:hypothetical protein
VVVLVVVVEEVEEEEVEEVVEEEEEEEEEEETEGGGDGDEEEEDDVDESKDEKGMRRYLRRILYGAGDVAKPRKDAVDALEEIAVTYIREMALLSASYDARGRKLSRETFLMAIRRDPKKMGRARDLLRAMGVVEEVRERRKGRRDDDDSDDDE